MMLWSCILAAIGIFGIYIAGKDNKWGWAIGLGAQGLWIIYALATAQYGFIFSSIGYGYFYGLNFYKWVQKEKTDGLQSNSND